MTTPERYEREIEGMRKLGNKNKLLSHDFSISLALLNYKNFPSIQSQSLSNFITDFNGSYSKWNPFITITISLQP